MIHELVQFSEKAETNHIQYIIASGNAVRKIPTMRDTITKHFGKPCYAGISREEAALGAAYATGVGLGLIQPHTISFNKHE